MPRLTHRSLAVVALTLTLLVGGACSSDGDDDAATTTSEPSATSTTDEGDAPTSSTTDEADEAEADVSEEFPCDLVTTEQVGELLGATLEADQPRPTQNSRNDDEWTSIKCSWASDAPEQEIDLDVALADGFASGEVECIEPMSAAQSIEGPSGSDAAYWTWDGILVMAELQVCTADALLEIRLDTWDEADEAGAQEALLALATTALANLETS